MDDHTVTGRVLTLLDAISASRHSVSLAALAAATGLPKPTVRRLANQLVDLGMLRRDPQGYRLGLHLIELGAAAAAQLGTAELAAPFVHELHQQTRQIAWICMADTDSLMFIDTAYAREHAEVVATTGLSRMPIATAASTAAAQLVLASRPDQLDQILRHGLARLTPYTITSRQLFLTRLRRAAETGVAQEYEETGLGWWCCAALVSSPDASYIFGLTGATCGISADRGLSRLRQVADQLTRELTRTTG